MNAEPPAVLLVGTLDTKGREYEFVRDLLLAAGVAVIVMDVGVLGEPPFRPDITAAEVARAAGVEIATLRTGSESNDARGVALTTMERGAVAIAAELRADGRCDGALGLGGSGGTTIVSGVLRSLPLGVPKLLVSTMASGNVRTFVGTSDICLVHAVTDVQGLNRVSRLVLTNAANAMAGMVLRPPAKAEADVPLVALTMMGVTTPGVQAVQVALERAGFETIVFHAVGSGGRAMEEMIDAGEIDGVIDITTSELTAEIFGGILSAGPDRLTAAGRNGIPQVAVPGALEVLNFGPHASVPAAYGGPERGIVEHNPSITSVRLTAAEAATAGIQFAAKLNAARGPSAVVLPLRGCSKYELPGGPFVDPGADAALFDAIRSNLRAGIPVCEVDANVNDPAFADAAVETFLGLWAARTDARSHSPASELTHNHAG